MPVLTARIKDKQPIVLIPGIQGTKLVNVNDLDFKTFWSGIRKYFSNIHDLKLQFDGLSDKGPENIVERADVENIAYSELVNYLKSLNYRVYIFGYDWRKSNLESARELQSFVEKIQKKQKEKKINFITHSMGALVLSSYLKILDADKRLNLEDFINKIVFTTPPFLGSVEAAYNLVIGKSRLFNTSDDFRKVGRTFPGLYELLPVYNGAYFGIKNIDFYDFDSYWQQVSNPIKKETITKQNLIKKRLNDLGEIRDQNNFIYDLNKLSHTIKQKTIILIGGGEKTKVKIGITENHLHYRYVFDFGKFDEVTDGGDGTVPLESSAVFKNCISTFKIDASAVEKRLSSKLILNDWHAFFLNNGRVQNIIKRFIDPKFVESAEWYNSLGDKIVKLK